jgi:Fe2+ transport system protein FeoA
VPLGTGFPPEGSAVVPCGLTLCDVKAGCRACVLRLEGIPPARREQLEAIGLRAGRSVRVLQHTPVTIVEVDQAEIALERDLARGISVTADLHSPANSSGGARAVS